MCKMFADTIPIYSYWRHPDLQNALRHHSGSIRESLGFRPLECVYFDNPRQMDLFWQASFPDLAWPLQCVGVVDYNVSNKPKIYLSIPPELKPRILTFSRKISDINNWCLAFINSQVRRCSVDSEWGTERRTNGGPGRKITQILLKNPGYTRRRIRRRVRSARELAAWLTAIFTAFGPLVCSNIKKVLLSPKEMKKAQQVVQDVLDGYVADLPLLLLYHDLYTEARSKDEIPMASRCGDVLDAPTLSKIIIRFW